MPTLLRILRFLGSFRGLLALCALALLVGLGLEWANGPVVRQLRGEAHPVSGSPTALSPADRAYLRRLVGDARVVGLGEGSHGSKEIFQYKASIIRFLVEEMGFSVLGMESLDDPTANRILQAGLPRMARLAAREMFPATEEFAALLAWMAQYRRDHPQRPLDLFGFDAITNQPGPVRRIVELDDGTRDRAMAETILAVLEKEYPGRKGIVWAHNLHVAFPKSLRNWVYVLPPDGLVPAPALRQRLPRAGLHLLLWFGAGYVAAATRGRLRAGRHAGLPHPPRHRRLRLPPGLRRGLPARPTRRPARQPAGALAPATPAHQGHRIGIRPPPPGRLEPSHPPRLLRRPALHKQNHRGRAACLAVKRGQA